MEFEEDETAAMEREAEQEEALAWVQSIESRRKEVLRFALNVHSRYRE